MGAQNRAEGAGTSLGVRADRGDLQACTAAVGGGTDACRQQTPLSVILATPAACLPAACRPTLSAHSSNMRATRGSRKGSDKLPASSRMALKQATAASRAPASLDSPSVVVCAVGVLQS